MRIIVFCILFFVCFSFAFSQQTSSAKANYQLASRFSPKKLDRMVFSTGVDPHWLKLSDRFWYMFETTAGKKWFIVDPTKSEKKLLFDNAKLAAQLTRIVKYHRSLAFR